MNLFPLAATRQFVVLAIGLALLASGGCRGQYSKLAKVSGTVTLDGQPLADALVLFSPVGGGSQSAGKTDGSGKYTLVYTRGVNGAEVGEHSVSISTFVEGDPENDPPIPEVPERVPYRYREPSELRATINKGSNTIDFALEGGPLEEAPQKGKAKQRRPVDLCY
jgi:hypothetical protein